MSPGRCPDSAGQVFQTQTSQTLTMCCQQRRPARRRLGPQESSAQGALRPRPLFHWGVRTVPARPGDAPLQSSGCPRPPGSRPRVGPWGPSSLSVSHACLLRPPEPPLGAFSLGTPCATPLPCGILALPRGLSAGRAPCCSSSSGRPGTRAASPAAFTGWGSEGSSTCARGGFQRGPSDLCSDVRCKHTSPGSCAGLGSVCLSSSCTPSVI